MNDIIFFYYLRKREEGEKAMVLKMKNLFKYNARISYQKTFDRNLPLETKLSRKRGGLSCAEEKFFYDDKTSWQKFSMDEVAAWRDSRVNCMQATWWNSEFEWIIEKVHRSTSTGYIRAASATLYCAPEISTRRDKSSNRNS